MLTITEKKAFVNHLLGAVIESIANSNKKDVNRYPRTFKTSEKAKIKANKIAGFNKFPKGESDI